MKYMEEKELLKNMQIIFNMEHDDAESYSYERKYGPKAIVGSSLGLLEGDPISYQIKYSTLDALKKLYFSIESNLKLKRFFISKLIEFSTDADLYIKGSRLVDDSVLSFATLLELGFIDDALLILDRRLKRHDVSELLRFLFSFIHYEYYKLTEENLELILDKINIDSPSNYRILIKKQINKIRYDNLLKKMEGINLEILDDHKKVIEKMERFGFDASLGEFLIKAESYCWDTSKDKFDWSAIIGSLREFSRNFVDNVAERIKEKTKEDFPKELPTPIGNKRLYIKKHLSLEDEDKLYDSIVDIINSKGSHKLITEKEYFRLVKNMIIEISMIILTKLEKFESN